MYINPFVAGVLVTIMSECIIVIAGAIITSYKKKNRK